MKAAPPHRRLRMRSVNNLRDLGGYPAHLGQKVRWHCLYRSGHLGKMSRPDLARLANLNLHTLIDFRSADEKQRHPDRLPPQSNIRILELPIMDEGNSAMIQDIRRRYENNDFAGLDTQQIMLNTYRQFAIDFTAEYTQFLQAVLEADGRPVLWHCTAGKDRAGFASALILRILGVDFPVIERDYLLSGQYIRPDRKLMAMILVTKGPEPVRLLKPLWAVQAAWIQAAFQAIDDRWGNFNHYLQDGLGLSSPDVQHLRSRLLE